MSDTANDSTQGLTTSEMEKSSFVVIQLLVRIHLAQVLT